MRRVFLALATLGLIGLVLAFSGAKRTTTGDFQAVVEERNPWSHLRFHAPEEFQFAIVSDRTGGHRARIFSQALEQINLLQPDFVLSVGDLIEGYTEEPKQIETEWKELQGFIARLQVPFFYVPGNHDVSNRFMEAQWRERFGRPYYHFIYRGVLFLVLNSDDERSGAIGAGQLAYVQRVLRENTSVRWTIVVMHKPLWTFPDLPTNGWLDVERTLAGRPYTVFVGHRHIYRKFVRNGQNYYQLATTGGRSRLRGLRYGEFDQIAWVTMKKDGPIVANILLEGVYTDELSQPQTDESGTGYGRRPVHPVRGKILFEGTPMPNAHIRFHLVEKDKKPSFMADALVEADGSYRLTTYSAFDGAPPGDYVVTVTWPESIDPATGKPHRNRLPEIYSRPESTTLRAQVKSGSNTIDLSLRK